MANASTNDRCGFCYVANSEAYLDEAMHSIASLQDRCPEFPIAVVTRRELFRQGTPVTDWIELQQMRSGPIVKVDAWLAPYDRVIFLDADTLVTGDLSDVFPLLDRFDFISVAEPNARPDRGRDDAVPEAFPEQNSGFLSFKKSDATAALFQNWLSAYDSLQERHGVTANQPSLRIALWRTPEVRQLTLGSEYNLLLHANCGVSGQVKVIHDRSPDRDRIAGLVNRDIGPRAIVAGYGPLFGFFTRRGWMRQYARMSWNFLRVLMRPHLARQQGHPSIWWRDGIDD